MRGMSYKEYKKHRFMTRELILSPWLTESSLNMIYAWRGVGKTYVSLEIAYAVASGGRFINWVAKNPVGVLYIDGEMPGDILQSRFANIEKNSDKPEPEDLIIYGISNEENTVIPDLATLEGQEMIDKWILPTTKLIIIDNLSCLVRSGGSENDAESWRLLSNWALQKRIQGKSIIFIHHSGKDGSQRGTSKREDILDTVISLKHPYDYEPSQGARFEVHFEKCRHLYGENVKPFIAQLLSNNDSYQWEISSITHSTRRQIISMSQNGMNNSEIARDLGISRQAVHKQLKKAKEENLL